MIINNEMIIIVRSPYYRLKKKKRLEKSKHIKHVNNIITVDQKNQCQVWLSLEAEVKQ